MRRAFFSIIVCVALAFVQGSVLSKYAWRWFNITPDLSFIAMIFLSLSFGRMVGQTTGFVSGLTEDFLSGAPIGFHALLKLILGSMFGGIKNRFYLETLPAAIAVIAIATVLKRLIGSLFVLLFGIESAAVNPFNFGFLFEVIANCILAIPLFLIIRALTTKWRFLSKYHEGSVL